MSRVGQKPKQNGQAEEGWREAQATRELREVGLGRVQALASGSLREGERACDAGFLQKWQSPQGSVGRTPLHSVSLNNRARRHTSADRYEPLSLGLSAHPPRRCAARIRQAFKAASASSLARSRPERLDIERQLSVRPECPPDH